MTPTATLSNIKVAIVTVSDSCFKNNSRDLTGAKYASLFIDQQYKVLSTHIIPDDVDEIRKTLECICNCNDVDIILFNGGTGITSRDVTPEAILPFIEKRLTGLENQLTQASLNFTRFAALSRLIVGTIEKKICFCFPGSKNAVNQLMDPLFNIIPHMIDLIRDDQTKIMNTHTAVKNCEMSVADRPRVSTHPIISVAEAKAKIFKAINDVPPMVEFVPLCYLRNRVTCVNLKASVCIPPYDVSIKDGYAVKFSDSSHLKTVLGSVLAGDHKDGILNNDGYCLRINTGAKIPIGADTVIQVEDTSIEKRTSDNQEEEIIRVMSSPKFKGENIRFKGSDLPSDVYFERNKMLSPSLVGLMASGGCFEERSQSEWEDILSKHQLGKVSGYEPRTFPCYKAPVVGIISTGNEITDPFSCSKEAIYDCNRPLLTNLLLNVLPKENIKDFGIAKDGINELVDIFTTIFSQNCDFIISSGGVSMGEKDLIVPVLEKYFGCKLHFGRVLMKPGKPTCFLVSEYNQKKTFIFGLPGNPASVFVTAHLYVIPAIKKFMQYPDDMISFPEINVKIMKSMKLDERPDFRRARLVYKESSSKREVSQIYADVSPFSNQMSSCIQSCVNADILLKLPPKSADTGEMLEINSVVQGIKLN